MQMLYFMNRESKLGCQVIQMSTVIFFLCLCAFYCTLYDNDDDDSQIIVNAIFPLSSYAILQEGLLYMP